MLKNTSVHDRFCPSTASTSFKFVDITALCSIGSRRDVEGLHPDSTNFCREEKSRHCYLAKNLRGKSTLCALSLLKPRSRDSQISTRTRGSHVASSSVVH